MAHNRTRQSVFAIVACSLALVLTTVPAHAQERPCTETEFLKSLVVPAATLVLFDLAVNNAAPRRCRWCNDDGSETPALNTIDKGARNALVGKHEISWDQASDILLVGTTLGGTALSGAFATKNRWQSTRRVAWAIVITNMATTGLKFAVARTRPGTRFGNLEADIGDGDQFVSFPSGHSSGAFAAAVAAIRVCRLNECKGKKWFWLGLAPATATAVFRIRADKHYASDIIAGAALGGAIGWFVPGLRHTNAPKNSTGMTGNLSPLLGANVLGISGHWTW